MVVRVYLKQAWNLMKQNPLFSTLYIVGTGISIVMTMVIAIVYYVLFITESDISVNTRMECITPSDS